MVYIYGTDVDTVYEENVNQVSVLACTAKYSQSIHMV